MNFIQFLLTNLNHFNDQLIESIRVTCDDMMYWYIPVLSVASLRIMIEKYQKYFLIFRMNFGIPLIISITFLVILLLVVVILWIKRQNTYYKLIRCGLPTVFWTPKFVHYEYNDNQIDNMKQQKQEKLTSSTITNILPRMERLKGPYGMYGTVYGISTAVVHIAHPIPVHAILSSNSSSSLSSQQRQSITTSSSNSSSTTKQPAYNHFKDFCGDGVFTANGEDWKMKRTAVIHALLRCKDTNDYINYQTKLETIANDITTVLIHDLFNLTSSKGQHEEQQVERNHNDRQQQQIVVNVVPIIQRATIRLIYRYIAHADLPSDDNFINVISNNNNAIHQNSTDHFSSISSSSNILSYLMNIRIRSNSRGSNPNVHRQQHNDCNTKNEYGNNSDNYYYLQSYLSSITRIRMIILAQSRSIWFLLPRYIYRSFASLYQYEKQTMIPIRRLAYQACYDAKPNSPLSVLQLSSDLYKFPSSIHNNDNENNKNNDNDTLDKTKFSKNLIDEAITLLFAGQDTSAATLSWTLHLLSLYPTIQDKLYNEIHTVILEHDNNNNDDNDREIIITKHHISQMKYLDAVIKESMRLYPVAPFIVRKLPYDVPIVDNNTSNNNSQLPEKKKKNDDVILPAGTLACIWIYSLHRHPEFWYQPNDFIPERWMVTTEDENKDIGITNGAYMPFAIGARNCIGQPLAHIILRTMLARLIYQYKFNDPKLLLHNDNDTNNTNKQYPEMLRKDMQAGFTVLPQGGVHLVIRERNTKNVRTP